MFSPFFLGGGSVDTGDSPKGRERKAITWERHDLLSPFQMLLDKAASVLMYIR